MVPRTRRTIRAFSFQATVTGISRCEATNPQMKPMLAIAARRRNPVIESAGSRRWYSVGGNRISCAETRSGGGGLPSCSWSAPSLRSGPPRFLASTAPPHQTMTRKPRLRARSTLARICSTPRGSMGLFVRSTSKRFFTSNAQGRRPSAHVANACMRRRAPPPEISWCWSRSRRTRRRSGLAHRLPNSASTSSLTPSSPSGSDRIVMSTVVHRCGTGARRSKRASPRSHHVSSSACRASVRSRLCSHGRRLAAPTDSARTTTIRGPPKRWNLVRGLRIASVRQRDTRHSCVSRPRGGASRRQGGQKKVISPTPTTISTSVDCAAARLRVEFRPRIELAPIEALSEDLQVLILSCLHHSENRQAETVCRARVRRPSASRRCVFGGGKSVGWRATYGITVAASVRVETRGHIDTAAAAPHACPRPSTK
mmetsp:Transcript_29611/g.88493  ORF Transcript_29611/g.88493 Transcript_29611/m.88493 type:complete len:426 (-) Transcript_29611:545-1822(-)